MRCVRSGFLRAGSTPGSAAEHTIDGVAFAERCSRLEPMDGPPANGRLFHLFSLVTVWTRAAETGSYWLGREAARPTRCSRRGRRVRLRVWVDEQSVVGTVVPPQPFSRLTGLQFVIAFFWHDWRPVLISSVARHIAGRRGGDMSVRMVRLAVPHRTQVTNVLARHSCGHHLLELAEASFVVGAVAARPIARPATPSPGALGRQLGHRPFVLRRLDRHRRLGAWACCLICSVVLSARTRQSAEGMLSSAGHWYRRTATFLLLHRTF